MKKLLTVIVSSLFILSGCSTELTPEQVEQRNYNSWVKTTFKADKYKTNRWDRVETLEPFNTDVQQFLEKVDEVLPDDRFEINVNEFTKINWLYKLCSVFVDENNDVINEPLPDPVLGSNVELVFVGHVSVSQLEQIAKNTGAQFSVSPLVEHLLSGATVNPPYPFEKYEIVYETETFKTVLTAQGDWNVYLWEGFHEIIDPGRWDFEEYEFPDPDYMPFTVTVYHLPPCEKQRNPLIFGEQQPSPSDETLNE